MQRGAGRQFIQAFHLADDVLVGAGDLRGEFRGRRQHLIAQFRVARFKRGDEPREFAMRPHHAFAIFAQFQRADVPPFNDPLLPNGAIPDFPLRLRLLAKQLLQWRERYRLAPEMESFARHLLGSK